MRLNIGEYEMRSVLLSLIVSSAVFLVGCAKNPAPDPTPPTPPTPPTKAELAIDCARQIVSKPSNWKDNCALLTDLSGYAGDLGILESDEFKNFDTCSHDLIEFGTRWIKKIDEGALSILGSKFTTITEGTEMSMNVAANVSTVATGGIGNADMTAEIDSEMKAKDIEEEAHDLVLTTIHGLTKAEAKDFGELFKNAQYAYRDLRKKLKRFEPAAEDESSKRKAP